MDINFTVKSGAPIASLYVSPHDKLDGGSYVPLKKTADGWTGKATLATGEYAYILVLRGGAPQAPYTLTIAADGSDPVSRDGKLDKKGNGGDVGILTIP